MTTTRAAITDLIRDLTPLSRNDADSVAGALIAGGHTTVDPDAAPEVTVDLLIAKYQGRQEGLRAKLRGYSNRQTIQAQADEINDFLTDLHRLRTTDQNGT